MEINYSGWIGKYNYKCFMYRSFSLFLLLNILLNSDDFIFDDNIDKHTSNSEILA